MKMPHLSVLTVRFPVSENYHRNGILAVSVMPARLDEEITNRAREIASKIIEKLDYVGVLCTELFVLSDGRLVVNELAPRPHNSGHATIDACICSQYEQQVRALCGLALGDWQALPAAEREKRRAQATLELYRLGAHSVIDHPGELPACLDDLAIRRSKGEKP